MDSSLQGTDSRCEASLCYKSVACNNGAGFLLGVFLIGYFCGFLQLEPEKSQMTDLVTYPQGKLKLFVAIQQNGDGTVVDEFDIHHRLKSAALRRDISFF